jgi:multicomponent K+:H+ antiporter subunit E
MFRRIIPYPLLTLLIVVVWLLLVNTLSLGALVVGLVLGVVISLLTSTYWPNRPRLRAPLTMIEYAAIVLWDIVVSNVIVAYLIIFRRSRNLRARFITVPLDLRAPEAIAVLAGTITMTPGTVSSDLSADGRALLVHCLDTGDPEEVVANIKRRYERRLMRIFP